ncbi:MAG: alpha-L-rhamnosidase C-terminal domain-containing protein, partial [Bacteroidota bacterium]
NGIPPGADDGYSANINLQFVSALQQAVEIFSHFNLETEAAKYSALERHVRSAVVERCYNPERKMIAETPGQKIYSQHTNIWAILTYAIPELAQEALMHRILTEADLIQTTIYYKFYLFRALQQCGMGDHYLTMLDPWWKMLDNGMSTFGERDGVMRSECHAWSSSPCFDFLHTVAGIYPLEPGFKSVAVYPNFGNLLKLEVDFPHPNGEMKVSLRKTRKNRVQGTIILPENTTGEFHWRRQIVQLHEGVNKL